MEPVWSEGPILPSRLVDILDGGQDNSDDDDTSDDKPDFDVAFSSNDNDYNNWTFFLYISLVLHESNIDQDSNILILKKGVLIFHSNG